MRRSILFVTPMLLSCAQSIAPTDTLISRDLKGRVAGPPQTCVPTISSGALTAIDASTLAYHSGNIIYLNHPDAPCPAIAPLSTLIVDAAPGHYCRGDRVRGVEYGGGIPGPVCVLGDWVAYRRP
jgi:hypothetical protein